MIVECPNCRKELVWEESEYRPFCSERCKLIDLGLWADENYVINTECSDINSDSRY